jgi:hypothetical protein
LDEFSIEAREYPQLASALEHATNVELSVIDSHWCRGTDRAIFMALVQAKTIAKKRNHFRLSRSRHRG